MFKSIKKIVYFLLSNDVFINYKIAKIDSNSNLIILNFHRISDDVEYSSKPISTHNFKEIISFLKKNFNIINFETIKEKTNIAKPKLIISFDDGYKDFLNYALPILKEFKITPNQNIIPDCTNNNLPPLNVLMKNFVDQANYELINKLKIPFYDNIFFNNKKKLGLRLSKFIKQLSFQKQKIIKKEIYSQVFNFLEFKPTSMMNITDIVSIKNEVELGAHSYFHSSMKYETDLFFKEDLDSCKQYFQKNFLLDFSIYAFPNGYYKKNNIEYAIKEKIKHILIVDDKLSKISNNLHTRFGVEGEDINAIKFKSIMKI